MPLDFSYIKLYRRFDSLNARGIQSMMQAKDENILGNKAEANMLRTQGGVLVRWSEWIRAKREDMAAKGDGRCLPE